MKMRHVLQFAVAGAFLALSGMAGNAATVDIGGNVNEGGGIPSAFYPSSPDQVIGDLPNDDDGTIYRITGDTTVFGGVLNRNGDIYQDKTTFHFDGLFNVVLSWFEVPEGNAYDSMLKLGSFSQLVTGNDSTTLSSVSGFLDFSADPTAGYMSGDRHGYTIEATLAPIPLPAAGWLLLAGLGGLAALRRRKTV